MSASRVMLVKTVDSVLQLNRKWPEAETWFWYRHLHEAGKFTGSKYCNS